MIRDSTFFKLALYAYEGHLQGLPEESRLQKIATDQKQEVSRHNEDKLRIIRNLYKSLEWCIGAPAPWIDTIYPAGKAWEELTDEEKLFIEQDVKDRQAHFLTNIREIADEQINILIEALERYVQKCSDGAPTLERLRAVQTSRRPPAEQAGESATGQRKVPGGFWGFCYQKIREMPEGQRERFLSVNSGDQSFYDLRGDWMSEYGKVCKRPGDIISKAKKLYRELNPELKN